MDKFFWETEFIKFPRTRSTLSPTQELGLRLDFFFFFFFDFYSVNESGITDLYFLYTQLCTSSNLIPALSLSLFFYHDLQELAIHIKG